LLRDTWDKDREKNIFILREFKGLFQNVVADIHMDLQLFENCKPSSRTSIAVDITPSTSQNHEKLWFSNVTGKLGKINSTSLVRQKNRHFP